MSPGHPAVIQPAPRVPNSSSVEPKLRPGHDLPVGVSAPTVSAGLTGEGAILGTLQYMAPEQLEGKEADHRTDIFAFGTIVYEMVAGNRAFSGGSQASLISAIMSADPVPLSSTQAIAPPALDRIVKTCLRKDPEDRWQSSRDVTTELSWVATVVNRTAWSPHVRSAACGRHGLSPGFAHCRRLV